MNEKLAAGDKFDLSALPPRVQQAIDAQQWQSERLIAATQLAIGLIWTALYFASPKAFQGTMFAPVPLALGTYLVISVARLWLVMRAAAPRWLLGASIVVDMSVLLVLIWSFHLQYEQPAAFYLKAPTLLYVFIFIALRALRFSPTYVLLAGAAAAAGWLVLLAYALQTSDAPEMGVTRDYVAYMTSNRVLIGAEFDKVIAILLTTAIIALAIYRARRLMVAAIVETQAHADLGRFFAPEVSERITASAQAIRPGDGERRQAAVLMVDIRGFTTYAKASEPAALMALLADYQGRMVAIIQGHGGSIDKFMGDGILATFGATAVSAQYAADALRAVDALAAEALAWRAMREAAGATPLEVGFAVEAGEIVYGAVGDPSRMEFTVIGNAVNRAAKFENANKAQASRALTSAEALALAEAQGYDPGRTIEIRRGSAVEGIGDSVDLAVLWPGATRR